MVEEFLGGVGEVICIMGTRVCKKGMGDVVRAEVKRSNYQT